MVRSSRSSSSSSSFSMIIFIVIIVAAASYGIKYYLPTQSAPSAAIDNQAIEQAVKEVIKQNPELIIEAFKSAQEKSMKDAAEKAKLAIETNKDNMEHDASSPFGGKKNGDVTVIEFFDYRCGYCKNANKAVQQLLAEDHNVKLVYKELPILGEQSEQLSTAALAVYRLDHSKYAAFHNELMSSPNVDYVEAAKRLGISEDKLKIEMAKPEIKQELEKVRNLSRQIGINGTPAFVIGGELVPGALDYDSLKAKIDDIRNK